MLVPEQLRRMAESFGDETAYAVVDGPSMTFGEWDGEANRLARGLVAGGVVPGDRVAIHVGHPNALRWMVAYAAIHRSGAVAVPVNPRLSAVEVRRMLDHAGAVAAVADADLAAQDAEVARHSDPPLPVRLVVIADRESGSAAHVSVAHGHDTATGGSTVAAGSPPGGAGTRPAAIRWDEVLADDPSPFQVHRSEDDLADILYTSGTTGSPKGVAVRHGNASMIAEGRPTWSGNSWLHASPLYTFAGISFVYTPMRLGLQGIYQPRFDVERWLDVVEREHPFAVFLVPAMAKLLVDTPRFATADLSSIELCSVGSAPLAPFVIERLQEKMPDALVSNNYGMTEAGAAYCLMPKGEAVKRPGSVGLLVPPAEVRITDPEGTTVSSGEIGEVKLRLPGRHREYFRDPVATASTWVDGWLATGDLGRLDDDGYLYIVGRSKDVIIRGGNNIHAVDVEHVIVRHPGVKEAAVIGVPHPVLGEDVVAFVVAQPGSSPDADALRAYCLSELADYKVPRQWQVIEELPRNATGKVVKSELRRRLDPDWDSGARAGEGRPAS